MPCALILVRSAGRRKVKHMRWKMQPLKFTRRNVGKNTRYTIFAQSVSIQTLHGKNSPFAGVEGLSTHCTTLLMQSNSFLLRASFFWGHRKWQCREQKHYLLINPFKSCWFTSQPTVCILAKLKNKSEKELEKREYAIHQLLLPF